MAVHIATVVSHDLGRNESTATLNDPNGVVLQTAGTSSRNSFAVLARQDGPSGIVSF
jgi:hypothetical protein